MPNPTPTEQVPVTEADRALLAKLIGNAGGRDEEVTYALTGSSRILTDECEAGIDDDLQSLAGHRLASIPAISNEEVGEMVERLGSYRSIMKGGYPSICDEAAALLTRLSAENDRQAALLREAREIMSNEAIPTMLAIRATAASNEWEESAEHFSALCRTSIIQLNQWLKSTEAKHE